MCPMSPITADLHATDYQYNLHKQIFFPTNHHAIIINERIYLDTQCLLEPV